MTTVNNIQGSVTTTVSQSSTGLLDRVLDWMNNAVEAYFGLTAGGARHGQPAEAYLFLNPSCCGGVVDSKLWDLLTDREPQAETEEASNV